MSYYLGTYQLLKLKPLKFVTYKGKKVLTGSSCLKESYYNAWSLSWTEDGKGDLESPISEFNITAEKISEIQKWADEKFNEKKIGWVDTFSDFETLKDYKDRFFDLSKELVAMAIYFDEKDIPSLISEYESQSEKTAAFGIIENLRERNEERDSSNEVCVGYDLIGLEFWGGYHSFHCYDDWPEWFGKFDIKLNDLGLIENLDRKDELLAYANNPENGLPYIPWNLVKVKKVSV